ncbi:hypothetical protein BCR42DRAFT_424164 [Absidia repens]|uniref:Galactose oxidase n=1 Tax=Absidia repens TaxID=90262 RepID=A0A1X2I4X0_9FUNG|nr:hypothetical protein BCR42DRAFT_424164 [Absidia repens]
MVVPFFAFLRSLIFGKLHYMTSFGLASAISPLRDSNMVSPNIDFPLLNLGCVLLQQKIYCYGGGQYVAGGTNYNRVLNDHFSLDLSKDFMVSDGQNAWDMLPTPTDFTLEPNYSYGYTILTPTSYLITSGSGYNDDKTLLKNKTTVYHADKDQWESLPTPANQSIGTTVNIDKHGTLYLFGGILTYTNTLPNPNFITLDILNEQWSMYNLDPDTILRSDHASAMDDSGIIYYVGGRLGIPQKASTYSWFSNVPLTTIITYDTTTQTWGNISVTGNIPTVRNGHSFTYVPKSNQFILFGGKQGSGEAPGSFDDICYTFDPKARNWTSQDVAQIDSGSRFGHSAVLYMDLYLFIVFGADHVTMSMNTFNVLDITTWTWLDNFSASGHPNTTGTIDTTPGNSNNDNNTGRNGTQTVDDSNDDPLGGGAIAGIGVGVAAFAVIVGAGTIFLCRRKRDNQPKPTPINQQQQDDFVMDYEFDCPEAPIEFTRTNSASNIKNASYRDQQYQLIDRVYQSDAMSTSTTPTYTSTSPIIVSPATTTTIVGHGTSSAKSQYKPDLTLDDKHDIDLYLNKPFGSN